MLTEPEIERIAQRTAALVVAQLSGPKPSEKILTRAEAMTRARINSRSTWCRFCVAHGLLGIPGRQGFYDPNAVDVAIAKSLGFTSRSPRHRR